MSHQPGELESPEIPGYEIIRVLERGGCGTVWQARGREDCPRTTLRGVLVAIKLPTTPECLGDPLTGKPVHPALVEIHEVTRTTDGQDAVVMEYVQGRSLRQWLSEERPSADRCEDAAYIISRVLAGLERFHVDARRVHGDIKPENILLLWHAEPGVEPIRIVDLGWTVNLTKRKKLRTPLGTPGYLAPEQLGRKAKCTTSTDVFSAALVLVELVLGRPAIPVRPEGRRPEEEAEVALGRFDPRAAAREVGALCPRLEPILRLALDKDPTRRLTIALFRRRLEAIYPPESRLVRDVWPEVIGSDLEEATKVLSCEAGRVVVEISSAALQSELKVREQELRADLNRRLPDLRIESIEFVLARAIDPRPFRVMILSEDERPASGVAEQLRDGGHEVHIERDATAVLGTVAFDALVVFLSAQVAVEDLLEIFSTHREKPTVVVGQRVPESVRTEALRRGGDVEQGEPTADVVGLRVERVLELLRTEKLRAQVGSLERQIARDRLTGLLSRARFVRESRELIERCLPRKAASPFHLFVLDANEFRNFERRSGRADAREALKLAGTALSGQKRHGDLLGRDRICADQFYIVCPRTSLDQAQDIARRSLERLKELHLPGTVGEETSLTWSVGIAAFPADGESAEELLMIAEERMLRAKQQGGNGLCWADGPKDLETLRA